MNFFFSFWAGLPAFLKVLFLSMAPLAESRVSIPLGLFVYKLDPWVNLFWAFLGNVLPAFFLYFFLKGLVGFLSENFSFFRRFFSWWFARVEKKYKKSYEYYGLVALVIFIGIPLPGTGVWTGMTAAYLFSLSFRKSILAVCLGAAIAGVIVTLASLGIFNLSGLI